MTWHRDGAGACWGHADGMRVGLAPRPGPRGLIRVYTPYLGNELLNFVAVEPTPAGTTERGYSELETSLTDGGPGLVFTAAEPDGIVEGDTLTVNVLVEPFRNGAHVRVRAVFRADRPHEVSLSGYAEDDSVALDTLILSATMGNYARLRRLHLAGRTVTPGELWPGFGGDGFTDHARFGLAALSRDAGGAALVTATPDEADPAGAEYAPDTNAHWRFRGVAAVQGWRVPRPDPSLAVQVNGRACYWASTSPIPGGVSYENFEIVEPYRPGRELIFSVEARGIEERR